MKARRNVEQIERGSQGGAPTQSRRRALRGSFNIDDDDKLRSRTVVCRRGPRPRAKKGHRGDSDKQLRITKAGDPFLRRLLVGCANYILGPFGADSDLRRWGLEWAKRGGKNAKKRAKVAVARKLAVLLHRLWVTGEAYEPTGYANKKEHQPAAA